MFGSGVPLWAIVLVACVIAPFALRAWADAERRRAARRTAALLADLGRTDLPRVGERSRSSRSSI
jgi:hypothetical protein